MAAEQNEYGIIGLGTMGRNLALNICDKGYTVSGFDKDLKQVNALKKEGHEKKILATNQLNEFLKSLNSPKIILMLVPAGAIVDNIIEELLPLLMPGDMLADCGNSHFTDTNRRYKRLSDANIIYLGIGISGGEAGARNGPSIMPGGPKEAYGQISAMMEAIAAKTNKAPCVKWLGPGSAGHYVKMVHNGIEYAMMQLISEAYHLLKSLCKLNNNELHDVFLKWNEGLLRSYLIEITADIFSQKDGLTEASLVDMILDKASQKGTGGWTSEDAMKLQVPIPNIDIAVSMRDLSSYKNNRVIVSKTLYGPGYKEDYDIKSFILWLEQALYFSIITCYAQGMSLLYSASNEYDYRLKLEDVASIWKGGCIIRSALLESICTAFSEQPGLQNIIVAPGIAHKLMQSQIDIRKIIQIGVENGIAIPAFMSALAYYDGFRSEWLPANLIQAQRDYFGAHTYERTDREGTFHTHWETSNK